MKNRELQQDKWVIDLQLSIFIEFYNISCVNNYNNNNCRANYIKLPTNFTIITTTNHYYY